MQVKRPMSKKAQEREEAYWSALKSAVKESPVKACRK